jgi:DNA-directed RNA polymerase specialized sigma24 family protein
MLQSAQVTTATKSTSTAFEDHTGMLHKLARRGWGRLQEAGLTTPYEDVFQIMCESFVRCQPKYDPATGFTFSAYYGRSCWNNFNKWAEHLIEEKHTLGMVSVEALAGTDEEGGEGDAFEFLESSQSEEDAHESPEDILAARQESHLAARMLSTDAKRVVQLVHHSPELLAYVEAKNARMLKKIVNINLWTIFDFLEIPRPRARAIRQELQQVYGVAL